MLLLLRFLTFFNVFFSKSKSRFCFVAYVFSNYDRQQGPLRGSSSPLRFEPAMVNPIKLAYVTRRPDGRPPTASAFNNNNNWR